MASLPARGSADVAAGACEVLAWALMVAVLVAAAGAATGSGLVGGLGGLAAVIFGVWQHRLPTWFTTGLISRFLGLPLAGALRPPSADWSADALIWWTACWAVTDLLLVLAIAAAAAPALTVGMPARALPAARSHVFAAVAAVVVGVASLSGLVSGGAASVEAAGTFLGADLVPVLATAVLAALAVDGGPRPRLVVSLFAAVGLDGTAGLLGNRDAWTGPQRLGLPPEAGTGQWQTTPTILLLTAITIAICLALLVVAPLAEALRTLQDRPGAAAVLGMVANTVDALATQVGLNNGTVAEANPVVQLTGMAGKWVVASLLLLALYRVHPRALWIPATAYLLVVAYHVVGAVVLT
jgi:hypothetical protein